MSTNTLRLPTQSFTFDAASIEGVFHSVPLTPSMEREEKDRKSRACVENEEGWGLNSLLHEGTVVPCPSHILASLKEVDKDISDWRWQTTTVCCLNISKPILSCCVKKILSDEDQESFILGIFEFISNSGNYFLGKAQSEYLNESKKRRTAIIASLTDEYAELGRKIIDQYISVTPHQSLVVATPDSEKETKVKFSGDRRLGNRQASKDILRKLTDLSGKWENIINVLKLNLKLSQEEAASVLSPLRAVVVVIKSNSSEASQQSENLVNRSDLASMRTHFTAKRLEQINQIMEKEKGQTRENNDKIIENLTKQVMTVEKSTKKLGMLMNRLLDMNGNQEKEIARQAALIEKMENERSQRDVSHVNLSKLGPEKHKHVNSNLSNDSTFLTTSSPSLSFPSDSSASSSSIHITPLLSPFSASLSNNKNSSMCASTSSSSHSSYSTTSPLTAPSSSSTTQNPSSSQPVTGIRRRARMTPKFATRLECEGPPSLS